MAVGARERYTTLLFDTGASRTIISRHRILSMDAVETGDKFEIVTANGKEVLSEYSLDSLAIREKRRTDFKILAHDLPSDTLVDGLLGWDFFGQSKFSIDCQTGTFEWTEASP